MKRFNIDAPTPQGPLNRNQQTFNLAMEFHEAAIRASEIHVDTSGKPVIALCPMIVSYAFAAELYLKALTSSPIKNHRLNVIFSHLEPRVRQSIETGYLTVSGRSSDELGTDLRAFANAFVEWRYIYEGDGLQVHTNLLIAFVKTAFRATRFLNPDWAVTPDAEARLIADEASPSMTVKNLGGGAFVHMIDGTGGTLSTPEAR